MAEVPVTAVISAFQNFPCLFTALSCFPLGIGSPLLSLNGLSLSLDTALKLALLSGLNISSLCLLVEFPRMMQILGGS